MSKGKQPRTKVKVPKLLLSEIKDVFFLNNQEIGLEAAIFWRPRNRALIKLRKKYRKFNGSKQYTETLYTYFCNFLCEVAEHWINYYFSL